MLVISPQTLSCADFDFSRDSKRPGILIATQDQLDASSVDYFKATDSFDVFFRFVPVIGSDSAGITSLADISDTTVVAVTLGVEPLSTFSDWQLDSFAIASPAGLRYSFRVTQSAPQRGYPHLSHLLLRRQ